MKIEILSIGSELTTGQNLDTNSQWLSRRLAEVGIAVGWHTTIADDLDINVEAFRIAGRRARVVISTGGLGPTQDDLTREALARVAGVELVLHSESLEQIEAMFRKRNRTMPERNRVQAYFPAGAEAIPNHHGTAPGVWMEHEGSLFVAMPGVPSEMHAMFQEQVLPRLLAMGLGGGVLIQRKINTFGAGESAIEEKLFDITRRDHVPEVGITASDATISLRILARGNTPEEAQAQAEPIERIIRERLGSLVFGFDEEDLQHAVARLLWDRNQTLATAEAVTGGQVAQRLLGVGTLGPAYRGGVVAADNRVKVDLLGVPSALIDTHGAVSIEVAEAMAIGCRIRMGSDLAVSTVGIAGSNEASPDKPIGLVHVGLAWANGVASATASWIGTREEIQRRAAKLALNRVRLHLLDAT